MAADPVVAWSCGAGALVWVGLVVRFVCVIRVPVCARVCPLSRLAACPGSPRCLFTGTLGEAEHTPNALPGSWGSGETEVVHGLKAVVFHSRWF
jgi:hypothetical protein